MMPDPMMPETTEPGPPAGRPLRWIGWILGIAVSTVVIVVALRSAEAREFRRIAERAEPWWLALAVVLQAMTYVAAGQVFRSVARAGGHSLGRGTASRLSLMKLFIDQAVPSAGLSGTVALASGLERQGLPRPVVGAGVVVDLASYYAAYVLSLALASAIAAIRGEETRIVLVASLVFVLFATAFSAVLLSLSGARRRALPRPLARLGPARTAISFVRQADPRLARNARLLLQATAFQLAIVLCDAGTVWALIRSLGSDASPSGVFASFMLSDLFRIVGIVPGGLGTFEAASVVTLRMVGVPTAVALAATLLFRGLSFWLPMLPGLWFSRQALHGAPTRSA